MQRLREHLWGRMVSCGRLSIGLPVVCTQSQEGGLSISSQHKVRVLIRFGTATILVAASCLAATDLRLVDAVKRRDQKTVASLIHEHADVNAAQPDGATALAWAAHLGADETAKLLLAAGANVNAADEYGETPLTLACANGDTALVQKLLESGAAAKAARWDGETALMIAASAGSAEAV